MNIKSAQRDRQTEAKIVKLVNRINRSSLSGETEVKSKTLEGTRLIHVRRNCERGDMKTNYLGIPTHSDSRSIITQSRLLISQSRHKQQHRQLSMLQRASAEIGIQSQA